MTSPSRLALAVSTALCLLCAAAPTMADPVAVRLEPTVSPGGVITARVVADIPAPLIGYGLDLHVDGAALALDGVEIGPSWFAAAAADGSPLVGLAFPGPVNGANTLLATVRLHLTGGQCKATLSVDAETQDLTEGFALVAGGFADFTPASATVSLPDTTPPVIANAQASPAVLWSPNHAMVDVLLNYGLSDNCDPAPALVCSVSVSSNEPADGIGSGSTSPDWKVIDAHHVQLRAERSGKGADRIYTNTITCMDTSGNTSSADVLVTVPHDQGH